MVTFLYTHMNGAIEVSERICVGYFESTRLMFN